MQLARQSPDVLHVTPIINAQALATSDGMASGVIVRGIPRAELEQACRSWPTSIRAGGGLRRLRRYRVAHHPCRRSSGRVSRRAPRAWRSQFLSPQGAATPFGLTPRRKSFLIGGVFSVGMAEFDSALIYMPLEQAQISCSVAAMAPTNSNSAFAIPIERGRHDGSARSAWVRMSRSTIGAPRAKGLSDALVVERNVMRLILMFVVGLGRAQHRHRPHHAGEEQEPRHRHLRTMGATKGAIMRVFFMASASLGVIGLSLGLLLGISFCIFIEPIQNFLSTVVFGFDIFPGTVYSLETLPARVEWSEVAMISFFTIAVTFAATLVTSWWASRFDPVEALRYE